MVDMEEEVRASDKLVGLAFVFAFVFAFALDDGSVIRLLPLLETGSVTFLMALDLDLAASGLVGTKPLHTEIVAATAATSMHL